MTAPTLASTREEAGASFPPRIGADVEAYDLAEVVSGYSEYLRDDPEPGPNRSPAYRWGWANRRRDYQHEDDGYDAVRREYFRDYRTPSPFNAPDIDDAQVGERS